MSAVVLLETKLTYYSARLLVVCIVDDLDPEREGLYTCDYPFVLFCAASPAEAFERALALGREQETEYKNANGATVRWILKAVEEIWDLGDDLDGVEVGSILDVYKSDVPLTVDTQFAPETKLPRFSNNSKPTQNKADHADR